MMGGVSLRGFARVMRRVQHMSMSAVGVMSCCLMMASRVVSGCFLVMLCCMFVVLGGFHVMGMCRVRF